MENRTSSTEASVAGSDRWPSGLYVVGVDGSDHSLNALRHAIRLANLTGARLQAVIAWEYPVVYGPEWTPTDWTPEKDARKALHQAVTAVVGEEIPSHIELVVRNGNSASALIDQSRAADILVVGSRGHGGFAGLLLGSVSTACAEHAQCPVLVVHGHRGTLADPVERAALDL